MSATDAVEQINALGLRVRAVGTEIRVSPKELVVPYREHLAEVIGPVREELLAHLQDADTAFLKAAEAEARARGYRMIQHRRGERPRTLVP